MEEGPASKFSMYVDGWLLQRSGTPGCCARTGAAVCQYLLHREFEGDRRLFFGQYEVDMRFEKFGCESDGNRSDELHIHGTVVCDSLRKSATNHRTHGLRRGRSKCWPQSARCRQADRQIAEEPADVSLGGSIAAIHLEMPCGEHRFQMMKILSKISAIADLPDAAGAGGV